MKFNKIYLPLWFFTAIAAGFMMGTLFIKMPMTEKNIAQNRNKQKLNKLIDFIDQEYVDKVDTDSIVDQTVNGILEKLDPHSVYIAKNDASRVEEDMEGHFVGIGVNFFVQNDTVVVVKTIENGPSEKAGIKAGDRILKANNEVLFGKKITTETLYSKLKGKQDSKVIVSVYRKSDHKKFNITIIRDQIALKSVDATIMLNRNCGYIKINKFSETTFEEFETSLEKLLKQGAKSLVIDLRENGGGYLDEAVEIADEFLSDKKLIVQTKNKKGRIDKTFATSGGKFETGKLTILVDENSASASEILAGAIQDNDRGTILGRRTFGKGLVQREMEMGDGSLVRLTIARYYTPSGRCIQKSYKNGKESYLNDFNNRFQNGELYAKDSIKIADTLKFKTTNGRIVFGGGGIVPDVFVGLEASKGNEVIPMLMQSGAVTNFVFQEIDNSREKLKKLYFNTLITNFTTDESYYNRFKKFISPIDNSLNLDANKKYIKRFLTAEFCRQLFGETQYYQVILKEDSMIKEALKN